MARRLPKDLAWIAPVGRLDKASEGLLLFTNDSEWAARVTNPETHLDKTYHVHISSLVNDELLQRLTEGIQTKIGEVLKAKHARLVRTGEKNSWVEIVLDEGKNRQIRRMFEGLGMKVLRLIRVAIGPVALGDLGKGGHRALRADEKARLDAAMKNGSV